MNIRNYNNRKRSSAHRLPIIFLGIYFILIVFVLFAIAPYAQNAFALFFHEYFSFREVVFIFVFLFLLLTIIAALLTAHFLRYRDARENDNILKKIGVYSDERRYLEQQIDDLIARLTNTEEKWAAINHLILAGNDVNFENSNIPSPISFLSGLGIDLDSIKIDKKKIFVLTPVDMEYTKDFIAVHQTCLDCHLQAIRGDEQHLMYGNKNMLKFIIESILSSHIVIANISNRNPNVFYELGIAHMAGKPTILLCRSDEQVAFDLQQKYVIFYSSEEELSQRLKIELISILQDEFL